MSSRAVVLPLLCAALLASAAFGQSAEFNGKPARAVVSERRLEVERVIVKWRNRVQIASARQQSMAEGVARLASDSGIRLQDVREVAPGLELLRFDQPLSGAALQSALVQLRAQPGIEFVEPDVRRHAHAIPSDALFPGQWYLQSAQPAAIKANQAWDLSTGGAGTVVAVLDTGVRFDHVDLLRAAQAGKLLPGYDFVSAGNGGDFAIANDGDGRDADPSDPGDWIDSSDRQQTQFSDCDPSPSSWHGTRVAGIIAAGSNNGIGIAGVNWHAWLLPVRVLGKCGGFDSDVLAAMRWAAGLSVGGVPNNPYPARIINLSLGSIGSCTASYRTVIDELTALGVLVVASAGNEGGPTDSPANCPGVLGVGGLRHIGSKVGYSNVGPEIGISAPAGNCVNVGAGQPCLFSIDTTVDLGTTIPAGSDYTNQLNYNVGTSFSAPIVAGIAALMHSVNAKLGPARLIERLKASAAPFATVSDSQPQPPVCHVPAGVNDVQAAECFCTTSTCGAGMADANAAVAAAQRPAASILPPALVVAGTNIQISGSGSTASCNRTLTTYTWTVQSSSGPPPTITGADQAVATVQAPTSGNFVLRLTVTDNQGAQDFAEITVTPAMATTTSLPLVAGNACPTAITVAQASTPPPTPPGSSGGGGGGGTLGLELLLLTIPLSLRRVPRSLRRPPV